MKRNNLIITIIVILLSLVAIYFGLTNSNYSGKKELRDFSVDDTASINKIFLVDKQNQQVLLKRENGYWTLNETYPARQDLVDLLLKTIKRVYIKAPVANAAMENIIKSLASKSTKVEIYQNDNLVKVYYVGGPTQDQQGTYMLLENSSRPFIMSIPGFRGYLSTRYITDTYAWKTHEIFNFNYNEIGIVEVENYEDSKQSFKVINNMDNTFQLIETSNNSQIPVYDTLAVKRYMSQFTNVNFDKFLEGTDEVRVKDSLMNAIPAFKISVESINATSSDVYGYRRPNYKQILDDEGNPYPHDIDFLYGLINNKSELVLIQYYVFDPLFKEIDDLKK